MRRSAAFKVRRTATGPDRPRPGVTGSEAPIGTWGDPPGQMFESLFNRSHYPPDRLHYGELPIFFVITELLHLAQIVFEAFWVDDLFIPFAMVEPAQPHANSSRSAHFAVHELIASNFRNIYRDLRLSQ